MAYDFVRASSQYLRVDSSPLTAKPITMFARTRPTNNTNNITAVTIGQLTGLNAHFATFSGAEAGDPAVFASYGSVLATVNTTGAYTINDWGSIGGSAISATSRKLWYDGVYVNENTTNVTTTEADFNRLGIGTLVLSNAFQNFFQGQICEVAVWSAELTDAEQSSLHKGFKPHRIRPQSLAFYSPLVRELIDYRGARTINNVNTATVAVHPRVY